MAPKQPLPEEIELIQRASFDSTQSSNEDSGYYTRPHKRRRYFQFPAWSTIRQQLASFRALHINPFRLGRKRRPLRRVACYTVATIACCTLALVVFTILFRPSYMHLPEHYQVLQKSCLSSSTQGRGNVNNEKIFIATALYDPRGALLGGDWGKAVLGLVELLGPENVHLSVYENDADAAANAALARFKDKLRYNSSIVSERLPLEDIPRITISSGETRTKRIAFLAEVRNRALRSLATQPSTSYDRLLYINDVIFNPVDAVQLLFSTNVDASGQAQYGAACAMDFINPFKFYDTWATRDFEGYSMGVPFYPWFSDAGDGISRRDVLEQKDAVRVRSCWGGMVAFEAKWFLGSKPEVAGGDSSDASTAAPLRFRYETDPFWDASECCLIHADLTYLRHGRNATTETGIYVNPYVRVAYDSSTLSWLAFTRRGERLYTFVQNLVNHIAGLPFPNVRRLEQPGEEVVDKVWIWDDDTGDEMQGGNDNGAKGSYQEIKRIASPGRFCGGRTLYVLNDDPKPGEKKWVILPVPEVLE